MFSRLYCLFICCFLISFMPAMVQAQELDEAPKAQQEESDTAATMFKAIEDLSKQLEPEQMRHFYFVYNNYNLVNTVKTVRTDVSNAINACGENNPEMKGKLDSRFRQWADAIEPAMKEAEANINNMVFAQSYAPPKDIRHIFGLVDATRIETAAKLKKVPVTSAEACQFLLNKMNDTQESMLSLLRATLISYPQSAAPSSGKDL